MSKYFFAANGMFDPDITGTGHQPMYFDQLMALYDHYTVIGAIISLEFSMPANSTIPMRVALLQTDDATLTGVNTVSAVTEQALGKSALIEAGGNGVRHLTSRWSAKKTFGGSIMGNDALQGSISSNPSELSCWCIGVETADLTGSASVFVTVNIDYIAIFDELSDMAPS